MGLINSLLKKSKISDENSTNKLADADMFKIQEIVSEITDILLKDDSQLISEVETGLLDRTVLEVEIMKIIDINNYGYDRKELLDMVFDWLYGYGPLQELIEDPTISDIDFTCYNFCTIKSKGKRKEYPLYFKSEKEFEEYVIWLISRRGGIINASDTHDRVADYIKRLRINGSISPRNLNGAALQIRKHPLKSQTTEDFIEAGMMNMALASLIKKLAKSSANIFVCGKGGSGKTTLLRYIVNNFKHLEMTLLCESDTEIYPDNKAVIPQKIKKLSEGGRPVTLIDLVNDGLTMSLDTYVIGEMIGPESWSVITTGLNGHRILFTGHTNSAEAAFPRLTTMVRQSNVNISESGLKQIYANALDVIIYMRSYKVAEILEVVGYDEKEDKIITNPIYKFNIERIEASGDDEEIFGTFGDIKPFKGRLNEEFKLKGYYDINM